MPRFFDLQKFAATGIASAEMSAYDKARALAAFGGKTQTLTDVPPLSFKADGKPLVSWSMLGNGAQDGTPTPENPIQPEFVGVRTGNLCSVSVVNSITWAKKQDDILAIINALPVGTYTFSYTVTLVSRNDSSDSSLYGVRLYKDNTQWQFLNQWNDAEAGDTKNGLATFEITAETVGQYTAFYLYGCGMNQGGATGSADFSNIMLNSGTTAMPYEPFGLAEKITCAGQTTPVYLGQVSTVRRIKKLVLTGDETFSAPYGNSIFYVSSASAGISAHINYEIMCSHFVRSETNFVTQMSDGRALLSATSFYVRMDSASTVDDFRAYLAQQYAAGTPVTIWYVLAEPETAVINEPLCKIGDYADELHSTDAAVTIPTVRGNNVLTVDTELQPSSMTITYFEEV